MGRVAEETPTKHILLFPNACGVPVQRPLAVTCPVWPFSCSSTELEFGRYASAKLFEIQLPATRACLRSCNPAHRFWLDRDVL